MNSASTTIQDQVLPNVFLIVRYNCCCNSDMVQMNGVLDSDYREYLRIYIFLLSDGSVFELLVKDEGKDVVFFRVDAKSCCVS